MRVGWWQHVVLTTRRLVNRKGALVQLLDPPFDQSKMNPGYIQGYVPGVRENGGQYTHAAVWAAMAFASLGERDRAWELLALINPVNHALTPQAMAVYKAEPYVLAADVYALAPHTGRGGWSWYTGSAAWLYRLIVESLLGLNIDGNRLRISPCAPEEWTNYSMTYRYLETVYEIKVTQRQSGSGVATRNTVSLDGVRVEDNVVILVDDRQAHFIDVEVVANQRSSEIS